MIKIQNYFIVPIIFILLGVTICFKTEHSSVAVIISNDNPIAFKDNSSLSANEVKLYFLRKMKTRWPETNQNILPVDRIKTCPEQKMFYSKVLNMSAIEVDTYFIEKHYEKGEELPHKFISDKEIIEFVGDEIGAIGYVNVNSLSASAKAKVKIVLIIND